MHQNQLILIISQPRSGSTLLQKILSRSQDISTVSETWLLLNILGTQQSDLVSYKFSDKLSHLALDELKGRIGKSKYDELTVSYLLNIYDCLKDAKTSHFLDKTPRYYEIVEAICDFLPESKKIILFRHPLNVLDSIIRTWITKGQYLGGYYRDLCIAPFKLVEAVDSHTDILSVRYEDIIASPEKTLSHLVSGIGDIDLDLDLSLNSVDGIFGDDGSKATRQNIDTSDNGQWKTRLQDPEWKGFFEGYAHFLGKDVFHKMGYDYPDEAKATKKFDSFRMSGEKGLLETDLSQLMRDKMEVIFDRFKK